MLFAYAKQAGKEDKFGALETTTTKSLLLISIGSRNVLETYYRFQIIKIYK